MRWTGYCRRGARPPPGRAVGGPSPAGNGPPAGRATRPRRLHGTGPCRGAGGQGGAAGAAAGPPREAAAAGREQRRTNPPFLPPLFSFFRPAFVIFPILRDAPSPALIPPDPMPPLPTGSPKPGTRLPPLFSHHSLPPPPRSGGPRGSDKGRDPHTLQHRVPDGGVCSPRRPAGPSDSFRLRKARDAFVGVRLCEHGNQPLVPHRHRPGHITTRVPSFSKRRCVVYLRRPSVDGSRLLSARYRGSRPFSAHMAGRTVNVVTAGFGETLPGMDSPALCPHLRHRADEASRSRCVPGTPGSDCRYDQITGSPLYGFRRVRHYHRLQVGAAMAQSCNDYRMAPYGPHRRRGRTAGGRPLGTPRQHGLGRSIFSQNRSGRRVRQARHPPHRPRTPRPGTVDRNTGPNVSSARPPTHVPGVDSNIDLRHLGLRARPEGGRPLDPKVGFEDGVGCGRTGPSRHSVNHASRCRNRLSVRVVPGRKHSRHDGTGLSSNDIAPAPSRPDEAPRRLLTILLLPSIRGYDPLDPPATTMARAPAWQGDIGLPITSQGGLHSYARSVQTVRQSATPHNVPRMPSYLSPKPILPSRPSSPTTVLPIKPIINAGGFSFSEWDRLRGRPRDRAAYDIVKDIMSAHHAHRRWLTPPFLPPLKTRTTKSSLAPGDADALCAWGVIQPAPRRLGAPLGRAFTVPKSDGSTSRFILDTADNDVVKPPMSYRVLAPGAIISMIERRPYMAECDSTNHFFQLPLHPSESFRHSFLAPRADGTQAKWMSKVLMMGWSVAPMIAHAVTARLSGTPLGHTNRPKSSVIIDNTLFTGQTFEELTRARTAFARAADRVFLKTDIDLLLPYNPRRCTHAGLRLDTTYDTPRWSLKKDWQSALRTSILSFLRNPRSGTALALAGSIVWWVRVSGLPPVALHRIAAWVSSGSPSWLATPANTPTQVSALATTQLRALAALLAYDPWFERIPSPTTVVDLWSDACTTGLGAVLRYRGAWHVCAWQQHAAGNMPRAEILASLLAITWTLRRIVKTPAHIRLRTDCAPVYHALRKGSTQSPALRPLLLRITRMLARHNSLLSVAWVPTDDMLADGPSRAIFLDTTDIQDPTPTVAFSHTPLSVLSSDPSHTNLSPLFSKGLCQAISDFSITAGNDSRSVDHRPRASTHRLPRGRGVCVRSQRNVDASLNLLGHPGCSPVARARLC